MRLGASDIRNIKRIAKRLGVRDSDIIRFAIKSTLHRIAPLCDASIRGRNLVPVLVESGDELIRYFELDAFRLESIINEQVDEGRQVDRDDIALLAMSGLREEYLALRLKDGESAVGEAALNPQSLRAYLYDKYVYRHAAHRANGHKFAGKGNGKVNGNSNSNGNGNGNGNDSVAPADGSARAPLPQPA
jgi:hypothetical protein